MRLLQTVQPLTSIQITFHPPVLFLFPFNYTRLLVLRIVSWYGPGIIGYSLTGRRAAAAAAAGAMAAALFNRISNLICSLFMTAIGPMPHNGDFG